jgi:2-polyprenyl-3-methyl-5-hydroxy-6-metoxy-1,4-benzoquinol methylase
MDSRPDPEIQAILQHNTGFDEPALWVDYARAHGFQKVRAVKVPRCPDCSAGPRSGWGQYVYYSTLIHLLECERCGLVWADAHIDPAVMQRHFESAYKGDEYFRRSRNAIFEHLATVIDSLAPTGARILDIGGARGDLMHKVVTRRPDLSATVHDRSMTATDWAATHFGFATLGGDADGLATRSERYDVVVLSDVLYYEPKLATLWSALSRLIRPGGAIVIRIPNRVSLMRLGRIWSQSSQLVGRRPSQSRVPFFNPEHIFVFSRGYLRRRLSSIGFARIWATPSPPLTGPRQGAAQSWLFQLAASANRLSGQRLVLTPSVLVIGSHRRPAEGRDGDA